MRENRARAEIGGLMFFAHVLPSDSRRQFDCGPLEEGLGLLFHAQKRPRFTRQRLVTTAGLPEKGVALFGRAVERVVQQLIEPAPPFRVHGWPRRKVLGTARAWRCSSRASPLRARR